MNEYEKMQLAILENTRLAKKVLEYKKIIKEGNFKLNIKFETDIKEINLNALKTDLSDDLKADIINYEIVYLDLDKVIAKHAKASADELYSKENLWVKRQPENIARLIEFIESGNKIYPPIIHPHEYDDLAIFDGNHRIGLFRFLKLSTIPFLVKKSLLEYVEPLK